VYSSSVSTSDLLEAGLRYARERGRKRVAIIASTDAGGQDATRGFDEAMALPENKDLTLVARESFNPADVSVSAQLTRIKAADPQLIVAWSLGTPAATLFRGEVDAGMGDIPTLTSDGNLTYAQMKQYESFLPNGLFFAGVPCVAPDELTDPATKAAVKAYLSAHAAIGVKPDIAQSGSWDPALIVVNALRKLGTDAPAAKIRDYINGIDGWVGVNGPYDFHASPQRGLGINAVIVVKWDKVKGTWVGLSKPGGAPLRS
jgi:branched-chain amino acid transport system substrate-binding protein